jgi:guanylate kinase
MYDYLVINDSFAAAVEELGAVITAEACRRELRREAVERILKTFAEKE